MVHGKQWNRALAALAWMAAWQGAAHAQEVDASRGRGGPYDRNGETRVSCRPSQYRRTVSHPPALDPRSSAKKISDSIWLVINNDRKLRERLVVCRDGQKGLQTAFDSGLIGLSTATVAAAFAKAGAGAIGGLGIAAGAVEQYRSYYGNQKMVHEYNVSLAAARCVSSQAEMLEGVDPEDYWRLMRRLKYLIHDVERTRARLPDQTGSGAEAANQAISAAESAYAALLTESLALLNAPSAIDLAHDKINNHLDVAGERNGPTFANSTAALQDSLTQTVKVETDTQAARAKLLDALPTQGKAASEADNAKAGAPKTAADPDVVQPPGNTPSDLQSAQAITTPQSAPAQQQLAQAASAVADSVAKATPEQAEADAAKQAAVSAQADASARQAQVTEVQAKGAADVQNARDSADKRGADAAEAKAAADASKAAGASGSDAQQKSAEAKASQDAAKEAGRNVEAVQADAAAKLAQAQQAAAQAQADATKAAAALQKAQADAARTPEALDADKAKAAVQKAAADAAAVAAAAEGDRNTMRTREEWNVLYVTELNAATEEAVNLMPAKRVTSIITSVQACVSGMS